MPSPNEPIHIDIPHDTNTGSPSPSPTNEPYGHTPTNVATPKTPFNMKSAQAMALSWEGLVFEVPEAKGLFAKKGKKQIVRGTSGYFEPGTLTALMGPSGAGKSTMMNVLAGRAPYGEITNGTVKLNGFETTPAEYQGQLAYVMQQDAMFATQTPREALQFTASLRLPEYSQKDRDEIVDSAIAALRLEKCADTMVGSALIPGLSGGEKKRAAVAVELISSPSLIFLDEPTSGLDSHTAHELVTILRTLAETGCTIVCTIHQPSSEVFSLFQKVIFLSNGHIAYAGRVEGVARHFETEDEICHDTINPADFAMHRLQTMGEREMAELLLRAKVVPPMKKVEGGLNPGSLRQPKQANVGLQLRELLKREFKQLTRDKVAFAARFGMAAILSILIGAMFYDVGSSWGDDNDPIDRSVKLQNHWGAMIFMSINVMFLGAQPLVLTFPLERAAFIREYTTGTYSAPAYLLAKSLLEIPAGFLQVVLSYTAFYFLSGLNGNFWYLVCGGGALAVVSASLGLIVGAATSSAETAVNILPGIYVPQILFSGFFVASDSVPVWVRWLEYFAPMKFGVSLVTIAEFDEAHVPDNRTADVSFMINRADINRDDWVTPALVMLGMFVGCRIIACILLAVRAKSFA